MLSTSFHAKSPKLYFGQNSKQVRPMGIFEQILINFFFHTKIFPIIYLTSKYAIYKFLAKNYEIVF